MKLEVIKRLPSQKHSNKPPLLFIHGAFTGAWCWDEYFLPYLASQGYPAYALSLRGHGKSQGHLYTASLANYVADVTHVIEALALDQPPVLIGHSMGGMVVQKYIERHPVQAAVLMNSVPPNGLACSLMYMSLTDPLLLYQLNLIQNVNPLFSNPNVMRRALFSPDFPDEKLARFLQNSQGESARISLDLLGWDLPNPFNRPKVNMLVLGAENDAFFPPSIVKLTATVYQAQLHIFEKIAHAMMLENNWQKVADYLVNWLDAVVVQAAPKVDSEGQLLSVRSQPIEPI